MYSFPSRSQRRQPFAFFIAIGYGSKYFTPAVTPPGRDRRARSPYAREAFVRASRSARGGPLGMCGRIRPSRYSLRGDRPLSMGLTLLSVVLWASRGYGGGVPLADREFEKSYATGDTPWDSGRPSAELVRGLAAGLLTGQIVLEIGCGTGTNAIELARRGYRVTAIDLVDLAVRRARDKAQSAGVDIDFRVGDATRMDLGGPFDVVFDRGVYHGIRTRNLSGFLKVLKRVTRPGSSTFRKDRKSTRLNSSHVRISYAVFCFKK